MLYRLFDRTPTYTLAAMISSGLFTFSVALPIALLLLTGATFYDNSRNA